MPTKEPPIVQIAKGLRELAQSSLGWLLILVSATSVLITMLGFITGGSPHESMNLLQYVGLIIAVVTASFIISTPYLALLAMGYLARKSCILLALILAVEIGISIYGVDFYFRVIRNPDPQNGLVFLVVPAYQFFYIFWLGVGVLFVKLGMKIRSQRIKDKP